MRKTKRTEQPLNVDEFLNAGVIPAVGNLIEIEKIVPDIYGQWRPLVRDAMTYVFTRLSKPRLQAKIAEQLALPPRTKPEVRLVRLISKMPGLQKIGQVLARNRHLAPAVRRELSKLENSISDVTAAQIGESIRAQLGNRLQQYGVEIERAIFSEASVSAVVRFTWRNPDSGVRERGVFKVLKPDVPMYFAEDMKLLKKLGAFLASNREYRFGVRDVGAVIDESRELLEHELDFEREQKTLTAAAETYKYTFGIRVPRLISPLCTPGITAMTEEDGVKITDAFPRSPARRARIAEQVVEGLLSTPLFARGGEVIFHADPHAGNLLYDEKRRELVILDWALAQRLTLSMRRNLALFVAMMTLRDGGRAAEALAQVNARGGRVNHEQARLIAACVEGFLKKIGPRRSPRILETMHLLDQMALNGVRFPAVMAMFRKAVFTLDGVLYDIAGPGVRLDALIARDYITRLIASYGTFIAPLSIGDWLTLQGSALKFGVNALRGAA